MLSLLALAVCLAMVAVLTFAARSPARKRWRLAAALASVAALLVLAGPASAAFVAPTDLTPYLPAANAVTVVKLATFSNTDVYLASNGNIIAAAKGTPLAEVVVAAMYDSAWKKLLAATTTAADRTNSGEMFKVTSWAASNLYLPHYYTILHPPAP